MTTLGFKKRFLANLGEFSAPAFMVLVLALLLFLAACTDKRPKPVLTRNATSGNTNGVLQEIGDLYYDEQDTTAVNITISGNSLLMTGYPFIFARYDIGAEPENPRLMAAAKRDILGFSPDPPFGGWTVDYFGKGALAFRAGYAYTSGGAGASVINGTSANFLREVARYPGLTQAGEQPQDIAYIYNAIVPHPLGQPILYGFSQSDRVYTLSTNGPSLSMYGSAPYSASGPVCCVEAAAAFNGEIYVAMRSSLWRLKPNGVSLQSVNKITSLQAVNVVATQRHLYVHHRPVAGNYNGLEAGIYVFNTAGQMIKYIPLDPLVFAVHPNDTYLYANVDDLSVKIYGIIW